MTRGGIERQPIMDEQPFSFEYLSSGLVVTDGTEARPPVEAIQRYVDSQKSLGERLLQQIVNPVKDALQSSDPILVTLAGTRFTGAVLRRIKASRSDNY